MRHILRAVSMANLLSQMTVATAVGTLHLTQAQAADAPARPENYDQIRVQTEQISHIIRDEVQAATSAENEIFFNLFVTVDKGPGSVYVDGESLTVAKAQCFFTTIPQSSKGLWKQ